MDRLFFDVVTPQAYLYDYHGRRFRRSEEAAQAAEMIALDLGCSETADSVGSQVQVRTATGDMLYSIPVVLAA